MQRKDANTNQRKIAKFILQKKETSKQEIASALELSMPTVLQNVKELVGKGLVTESGKYDSTGGRKAAVLSVAKNFRTPVGIDITANHVSYVLTDLCGDVIAKTRIRAPFENSPLAAAESTKCLYKTSFSSVMAVRLYLPLNSSR